MKRFVVFLIIACVSLAIFSSCDTNETSNIPNESDIIDISETSVEQSEIVSEISEIPFVYDKKVSEYFADTAPAGFDVLFGSDIRDVEAILERGEQAGSPTCIAIVRLIRVNEQNTTTSKIEYELQIMEILEKNSHWNISEGTAVSAYDYARWYKLEDDTYRIEVRGCFIPMAEPGSRYMVALYRSELYNNDMYFVIPYTLPLDETYQYTDFHVGLIENWHTAWQRCRSDLALLKYGFITEDALTFDPNTGEWRDTSQ